MSTSFTSGWLYFMAYFISFRKPEVASLESYLAYTSVNDQIFSFKIFSIILPSLISSSHPFFQP